VATSSSPATRVFTKDMKEVIECASQEEWEEIIKLA
jgi:hypothetical protein